LEELGRVDVFSREFEHVAGLAEREADDGLVGDADEFVVAMGGAVMPAPLGEAAGMTPTRASKSRCSFDIFLGSRMS
jgi:ribulose 1,5-bisphosphate carboxylase large subunit-like protein